MCYGDSTEQIDFCFNVKRILEYINFNVCLTDMKLCE